jgi:ABC-type glycerol-3-phosphate transport system substrate-binding protein
MTKSMDEQTVRAAGVRAPMARSPWARVGIRHAAQWLWSVVIGLALLAAGCSATNRATATPAGVGACPTTLPSSSRPAQVVVGYSRVDADSFRQLADQFNQTHPSVQVVVATSQGTLQGGPSGFPDAFGTEQRFFDAVRTHKPVPDIIQLETGAVRAAIDTHSLVPAQDCIDSHRTDLSDVVRQSLRATTVDGQVWGMPLGLDAAVEMYNTQSLVAAGVDPRHPPATYDDFVTTLETLQRRGLPDHFVPLQLWWMAQLSGVSFTDHNGGHSGTPSQFTFDTPTLGRLVADSNRLDTDHLEADIPPPGESATPVLVAMAQHQAVAAPLCLCMVEVVAAALDQGQAPGLTLTLGPIPSLQGPGGSATEASGDLFLTAGSTSARRAAAWTFLDWLQQPAQQAEWALMSRWELPDRTSATRDPRIVAEWNQYPLLREAWNLITTHPVVTSDPIGPWVLTEGHLSGQFGQIDATTLQHLVTQFDQDLTTYNANPGRWTACYTAILAAHGSGPSTNKPSAAGACP